MQKNNNKIALFGSVKILVFAALMCALSGGLKFLAPTGDTWRISLENFPIIFSGIVLGPYVASAVGIVSDLLGCLFRGFAINPFITLASMSVGLVSGIVFRLSGKRRFLSSALAVVLAHTVGNVLIKSVALSKMYGTPFLVLLAERSVTYALTALAESVLIIILLKNKAIQQGLKKVIGYEL
ncbi:MAG: folate family ECF transporter S component [Clostridia bacterium]|nr:folate family ECF transporter S component [Clostridia bacterium]